MSGMDEIVEYALNESKVDYVGLWQVCGWVRRIFRPDDPSSAKQLVFEVVRALLRNGLEAVDLAPPGEGCRPWTDQPPDAVIKRISEEWTALGRNPNPGEAVWFHDPNLKPVN